MTRGWNSRSLVIYFYRQLQKAYELPPGEYHRIQLVRNVLEMSNLRSWFAEHGYGTEGLVKFIDWFFQEYLPQSKHSRVPHIGWLRSAVIEYLAKDKVLKRRRHRHEETVFQREAYENDLSYFGMGYKHGDEHEFTKLEYWLGFWWRRRNLSPEEMDEYREKQRVILQRKLGRTEAREVRRRFQEWEDLYRRRRKKLRRKRWARKMRRIFLKVQARRRGWSLSKTREHYGLEA